MLTLRFDSSYGFVVKVLVEGDCLLQLAMMDRCRHCRYIEMVGIVLLFGRTVGVGAGGERWQGDRGTDIAVASESPDQAVGISHPEFCWWSRSRFKGATVICHLQPSQGQTCCAYRFVP